MRSVLRLSAARNATQHLQYTLLNLDDVSIFELDGNSVFTWLELAATYSNIFFKILIFETKTAQPSASSSSSFDVPGFKKFAAWLFQNFLSPRDQIKF